MHRESSLVGLLLFARSHGVSVPLTNWASPYRFTSQTKKLLEHVAADCVSALGCRVILRKALAESGCIGLLETSIDTTYRLVIVDNLVDLSKKTSNALRQVAT